MSRSLCVYSDAASIAAGAQNHQGNSRVSILLGTGNCAASQLSMREQATDWNSPVGDHGSRRQTPIPPTTSVG